MYLYVVVGCGLVGKAFTTINNTHCQFKSSIRQFPWTFLIEIPVLQLSEDIIDSNELYPISLVVFKLGNKKSEQAEKRLKTGVSLILKLN